MSLEAAQALAAHWEDALCAAELLAIDPLGLGGAALRVAPGPLRDLWLDHLTSALPAGAPVRRMPAGIGDDRLIGAVDLPATLRSGRPVLQQGLLAEADGGLLVIPMAERLTVSQAARIKATLERHELRIEREGLARTLPARLAVIACDEGIGEDEMLPALLADRLAFLLDFSGFERLPAAERPRNLTVARAALSSIAPPDHDAVAALVTCAAAYGIVSLTAPLFALRAARAAACRRGASRIEAEDLALAARLVLAPRALSLPSQEEQDEQPHPEPPPPEDPPAEQPEQQQSEMPSLDDVLLAAVQAALPENLLRLMQAGGQRRPPSRRSGSGAGQISLLRGRPAGVTQAALRPGSRLALIETLRAAAPWQGVRSTESRDGPAPLIQVRREDFRIKRFIQRRESTIIFCVDASGSAAFHRLAESKGAVELLLAEAYIARTYAALVAFRGSKAEVILPATRSLSRAKALLAGLPGGGGTPLAAGIDLALLTAMAEKTRGREPMLVLLTDGRGNIDRDGQAIRSSAARHADEAAARVAASGIRAVFVDTAPRPRDEAAQLAALMCAHYVALPYVEAEAVHRVVRDLAP